MQVGILGPLDVSSADGPVTLSGPKQRLLLALLVVNANSVVSADRLVDSLWRAGPPDSGLAALRMQVARLRKTIPERLLVTKPPGYMLSVEPEAIDAHRFESLCAAGRQALIGGAPGPAAASLREALALWRGPALEEFDDPLVAAEAARLEECRLACLEERIEADLALGHHFEVVTELERLAAEHPSRESVSRQLMIALYRCGRQADALAEYRATRQVLVTELGLEPGRALQALEQAILRQESWLDPPPRSTGEALRRSEVAFAERERKVVTAVTVIVRGDEAHGDLERSHALLERNRGRVAREIKAAEGTVERSPAGAVVGLFGAPTAQEDHAERALEVCWSLTRQFARSEGAGVTLHLGVDTGEVLVVAGPGDELEISGPAVERATRLAEAAPEGHALAALPTVAVAGATFEFGEEPEGHGHAVPHRRLERALSLPRPARARTPLVGRERELELLKSAYGRATERGAPEVVMVLGEPGVGKTRLVEELWSWLAKQSPEPTRRSGRCVAYGSESAYRPLADVLREELGLTDSDHPEVLRQKLAFEPVLGLTLGLEETTGLHPLEANSSLHTAWVRLVSRLATERPTALLLENLHWARDPLLELLQRIVREVEGPLLLVVTGRPELPDLNGEASFADGVTVWLDRLTDEQAERLLAQRPSAPTAPIRRLIVERADGNPFFLEELAADARHAEDHGNIAATATPRPPTSVQSLIGARIDSLPQSAKSTLQAASVVGRVFWYGSVQELLDGTVPDLASLEEGDFVRSRSISALAGDREFEFKHALTREVAYASLTADTRALLHARFAHWLEESCIPAHERADLLAQHYAEAARPEVADLVWRDRPEELAGLTANAYQWLLRAGQLASQRYELDRAVELSERALEFANDDAALARAWRELGRAHALRFDGEAFRSATLKAIELEPDPARRGELYATLAYETCERSAMWTRRPEAHLVESWVEEALSSVPQVSVPRLQALAARVWVEPRDLGAAAQAWALAEQLGTNAARSTAAKAKRITSVADGDFAKAASWDEQRIELSASLADPAARADILADAAPSHLGTGRLEEAREIARAHDQLTADLTPHHRVHGVSLLVEVEECAAGWERIQRLEDRLIAAAAANDTFCVRQARSLLVCAAARTYLGDEDAAQILERQADAYRIEGYDLILNAPRLRLALARGDHDSASRLLTQLPKPEQALTRGRLAALQNISTRLDALTQLRRRALIEREAPALLTPGTYLEPFALRALGVSRNDRELVERARDRFVTLGLAWHARNTGELLQRIGKDGR